jgi:hypothetical protein
MSAPPSLWSASPLGPPRIDVARRLASLRAYLDPNSPRYFPIEGQHDNIRAAIKAFEDDLIDGSKEIWFAGGKIVTEAEAASYKGFVNSEVSHQVRGGRTAIQGGLTCVEGPGLYAGCPDGNLRVRSISAWVPPGMNYLFFPMIFLILLPL